MACDGSDARYRHVGNGWPRRSIAAQAGPRTRLSLCPGRRQRNDMSRLPDFVMISAQADDRIRAGCCIWLGGGYGATWLSIALPELINQAS